jgi:hypothetical protein
MATFFAPQVIDRTAKLRQKPSDIDGTIAGKVREGSSADLFDMMHYGGYQGDRINDVATLFGLQQKTIYTGSVVTLDVRKGVEPEFLYFAYPINWKPVTRILVNNLPLYGMEFYMVDSFYVYRSLYPTTATQVNVQLRWVI